MEQGAERNISWIIFKNLPSPMIIVINQIEHLFELLSMLRNYKNRLTDYVRILV